MKKNKRPQTPKPISAGRNQAFNEATLTRHAASARRRPLATNYKRSDKSWRKEY